MYLSANGSQMFIGGARSYWDARAVSAADFIGEAWTSVAGVMGLGRIAGSWSTEDYASYAEGSEDDAGIYMTAVKTIRPAKTMTLVTAMLPEDPGQVLLLQAEDSPSPFAFRLVLPAGHERLFVALVVGVEDAIEEGEAVLSHAFDIRLQSSILRIKKEGA